MFAAVGSEIQNARKRFDLYFRKANVISKSCSNVEQNESGCEVVKTPASYSEGR
jgi:hypothetical protein